MCRKSQRTSSGLGLDRIGELGLCVLRSVLCAAMVLPGLSESLAAQSPPQDLATLRLEDLMNIEVTSVSKKEQKMSKTASAVFVITPEDIARSGATNVPDLLRMVPGVEVAQINSSTWAISIRGFNGQYSNKLLVLVDGRTVYTSMFSGVYWDAQDVLLSDIDRIEVIRGAGGTIWGANAVNGVINIITKRAGATQGGLITAGGGTYEHGFGAARYGGRLGNVMAYRIFGDGFSRGPYPSPSGTSGEDDWKMAHGGFRADVTASPQDSLVIEGGGHSGDAGEIASSILSISPPINALIPLREHYSGWDVLSRWNHILSPRSETSLQVYFDRITRDDTTYGFGVNTFDIDFQHHVGWRRRHDFVWGLGYRLSSDTTLATLRIVFNPVARTTHLFSAFVQDEIAIRPDHLSFTWGARLEHNDYTGFGFQPSVRAAWTPSDRNTFWTAFSRSERTPSRSESDVRANWSVFPGPNDLSVLIGYAGSPHQKAEKETSVEAGYRAKVSDHLAIDTTAFFNDYTDEVSVEPGLPEFEAEPAPPHLALLSSFANLAYGETHGFETFADWRVTERWTLSPGYSFLSMHIHQARASHDLVTAALTEGSVPAHQAELRSHVSLPGHLGWNTAAYFVGPLSALAVPSYTRLDSNLTWQAREDFSVSLVGQNLLRDRHLEFGGPNATVQPSLIKRSAYVKVAWSF